MSCIGCPNNDYCMMDPEGCNIDMSKVIPKSDIKDLVKGLEESKNREFQNMESADSCCDLSLCNGWMNGLSEAIKKLKVLMEGK